MKQVIGYSRRRKKYIETTVSQNAGIYIIRDAIAI